MLRHDVRFDGSARAWTTRHRDWLGRVDLGGAAQVTLIDYLVAIDARLFVRRDTLEGHLERLVPALPWSETVARLRCLSHARPARGPSTSSLLCEDPRRLLEGHADRTPAQARETLRQAPWHDRRVHQPSVR